MFVILIFIYFCKISNNISIVRNFVIPFILSFVINKNCCGLWSTWFIYGFDWDVNEDENKGSDDLLGLDLSVGLMLVMLLLLLEY